MGVFSQSLRVLTVSAKLRLFLALAATLCGGLLFLLLASIWFGADISAARATEESLLVRDVNVRNDPDRQDDPEDEFQLEFINETAYEADNLPQVTIESFVFIEEDTGEEDGSSLWESVEEGDEVDHSAHTWVSGSDSLSDIAEGAVNELDFVVDVPLGTENGSYTAAVVIRDQDSAILDYQLIVINVGMSDTEEDSRYDLELSEISYDSEAAEARVVITNKGLWHIAGSVELRLKDKDDAELMVSLLPESEFPLTLFPGFEKAWVLEEQSVSEEVQAFIEDKEDFDAELVFLVSQDTEEIVAASWDIKADITSDVEGDANSSNEGEDGDAQAGQQQEAGDGQSAASSSDGNFLTDNLILLIGAGGALVVIVLAVLLVIRRRRPRPAAKAPAPASSVATPQPEQEQPPEAATVPPSQTDIASNDSGGSMPVAEEPVAGDSGILENLPAPEAVQDLSLPAPDLPEPVNEVIDTTVPPASSPPPQASETKEEESGVVPPVLEGMPQLPPLEDVIAPARPEIPVDVPPPAETTPVTDGSGNPPQTPPPAEDNQQPPAAAV